MFSQKINKSTRDNRLIRYAGSGDNHVEKDTPLFASNNTELSDFMKQHKTLLASAVVLALGLSSFAIAERPPQCDQAEEAIRALGVEPGDLAQVEFSEMRPREGASEEEHAAFDDMLDNEIADAFFGGDTEVAAAMFEQLDQFDVNPEDCGYFPPGMTAEMMQQGSGPDDEGMHDDGMHDHGMTSGP